jgi:hypothetical protein
MMPLALYLIIAAAGMACADSPPACIQSFRIDCTDEVKGDRTILFYMIDQAVYRNTLQYHCFGLLNATRGFGYEPTPGSDEMCSNLQTTRVNDDGNICELRVFEKLPEVEKIR